MRRSTWDLLRPTTFEKIFVPLQAAIAALCVWLLWRSAHDTTSIGAAIGAGLLVVGLQLPASMALPAPLPWAEAVDLPTHPWATMLLRDGITTGTCAVVNMLLICGLVRIVDWATTVHDPDRLEP